MIDVTCVFLGTPEFAIPSAEVLTRTSACEFLGVITKPDEPVGRTRAVTPPPVAAWASARSVRYWQPETKQALTELLRELRPDVVVVVAYGRIIPPEALTIPKFGFLNLHPSLLPKYRGPSPTHAAIANGDSEAGVTLMLLDDQVDHGPIVAQERVPISPTATRMTLERELAERGAALLERTLLEYLAGRITPQRQDDAQATTCPLLSREDGRLDWRKPAAELERLVRAYEGWPGTWALLPNGKRLKVHAVALGTATASLPGTIVSLDAQFAVACGDQWLLVLTAVQPEGGRVMDGSMFLRGHRGSPMLPLA